MAKYIGSPFGIISGRVGNTVAYYHKGRSIVRAHHKTTYRWSKEFITLVNDGKANKDSFSVAHANCVRIMGILTRLAKLGRNSFISPVWDKLVRDSHLPMIGLNLFVKRNFTPFYKSLPNRAKLIGSDNLPDFRNIVLMEGILEPAPITCCEYKGNEIRVSWESLCYRNGSVTDKVHIFVVYFDIEETDKWYGVADAHKGVRLWSKEGGQRESGYATIEIDDGLDKDKLTVYIGFSRGALHSFTTARNVSEFY